MTSRILITGAAGLIGTATRMAFENSDWEVKTLDIRRRDLDRRSIDYVCDILTIEKTEEILSNVDGIVHLAAVSRVIDAEFNQELCTRTNIEGTIRVLQAASAAGCSWFIFASSREVYGEQVSFPVNEEGRIDPINHYGRAKVLGEKIVRQHCNSNGMSQSILRFSNVYGHPADSSSRIVNAFIREALSGGNLEIHGGEQIFDLVHVNDVVSVIVKAAKQLQSTRSHLPVMNVSTGIPTSIEKLTDIISEKTGEKIVTRHLPGNEFSVNHFCGDPTRMKEVLGFRCSLDLSTGIELAVEAQRNLRDECQEG
ncbi:MAG: NAD(P)-dependent oxidoreductase [Candidatus Thalassarchaeaceae archaeon]|jgi:nucleoside-diphosphate-sugar epimerase|nr:NAD(P)-dependent oxidoreductase [Candidatus Thalassarchaeaceae archaeon]